MENDILIHNGILLTMEDGLPVIENGFVHIKQGKIADCGPALPEQIRNLAQNPARQIDACGGIIMPGLVNGHTHTPMSMFRDWPMTCPWISGSMRIFFLPKQGI